MTMRIVVPELSFVILIGPSGSGKTTFARRHFRPTEILSSDVYRGLVSDDETDQTASDDAFEALYCVARKRLARGRLTVLDATNVHAASRTKAVSLARELERLPIAIVFDLPEQVCNERNRSRTDRDWNPYLASTQRHQFLRGVKDLEKEGFRKVYLLSSVAEVDAAVVAREPL